MDTIAARAEGAGVRRILDLGCGTGRFSDALAMRFDADVIGIDPSVKMLREAMAGRRGGRVCFANGAAEATPLSDGSVDMVFISMVFHHFTDPRAAAAECHRVLRADGYVCLRTACAEKAALYPYVPFFPTTIALLEKRLPSVELQRAIFEDASLQTVSCDVVTQQIASDLFEYSDKLAVRADSILASLEDGVFEGGLKALRSAAAETPRRPVTEPIDFLVFRKPA
jgi:SAM-dependent methyltransferase